MAFVAIAIGASAVIGAGASLISGNKASKAQQQAANQSTALQQAQDAEARRQYDLNRSDLAPWRQAGTGAVGKLSNAMGIGAAPGSAVRPGGTGGTDWGGYVNNNPAALAAYNAQNAGNSRGGTMGDWSRGGWSMPQAQQTIEDFGQQYYNTSGQAAGDNLSAYQPQSNDNGDYGSLDRKFTMADFQTDPGAEFRRSEGQRGLEASASARGGILSGGALKAISRYNSDQASQEYGAAYNRFNNDQTTRFNRLSAIAGTGQTATNTGIAAGSDLTASLQGGVNNITNNIGNAANARASAYINTGNAITGAAGQVGNYFAMRDLYKTPPSAGRVPAAQASQYAPSYGGVYRSARNG